MPKKKRILQRNDLSEEQQPLRVAVMIVMKGLHVIHHKGLACRDPFSSPPPHPPSTTLRNPSQIYYTRIHHDYYLYRRQLCSVYGPNTKEGEKAARTSAADAAGLALPELKRLELMKPDAIDTSCNVTDITDFILPHSCFPKCPLNYYTQLMIHRDWHCLCVRM